MHYFQIRLIRRVLIRTAIKGIKWLFRRRGKSGPELPGDPYAYVTAPRTPRRPSGSATAIAENPEEFST
jgi:hypothetical protein